MDIYDFFNSPDVAEYCQSTGKTFNALESAVMISQSYIRTLAEKHAAYRTILAEYPDMESPKILRRGSVSSVHKALKSVLAHEERVLEKFLTPETGAIYQLRIKYRNYDNDSTGLFTSYERALSDALELSKRNENIRRLEIYKHYPDSENRIEADISLSGKIMDIKDYGVALKNFEKEFMYDCYHCLDQYIDVPVPFKRGDLVELDDRGYRWWQGNVFVLSDPYRKDHTKLLIEGDICDMNPIFFFEREGLLYCDWGFFYPDLRYCRRELEGEKRILKYLGHFKKDEMCVSSLLKFQKYLFTDKILNELKHDHDLNWELNEL